MFSTKKVTPFSKDVLKIRKLYIDSFPENERFSFRKMILNKNGHYETFAFYNEGSFCGFAILLNSLDISHIIYFATLPEVRGKGLGAKALSSIGRIKSGMRIIVDIEREVPGCAENEIRRRRKNFYLRNGFSETEVRYRWQDEAYEILVLGGKLSGEDFGNFWKALGINKNTKDGE